MSKVYAGLLAFFLITLAFNVLIVAAKAVTVLIAITTITYFLWRKKHEHTNR